MKDDVQNRKGQLQLFLFLCVFMQARVGLT